MYIMLNEYNNHHEVVTLNELAILFKALLPQIRVKNL